MAQQVGHLMNPAERRAHRRPQRRRCRQPPLPQPLAFARQPLVSSPCPRLGEIALQRSGSWNPAASTNGRPSSVNRHPRSARAARILARGGSRPCSPAPFHDSSSTNSRSQRREPSSPGNAAAARRGGTSDGSADPPPKKASTAAPSGRWFRKGAPSVGRVVPSASGSSPLGGKAGGADREDSTGLSARAASRPGAPRNPPAGTTARQLPNSQVVPSDPVAVALTQSPTASGKG